MSSSGIIYTLIARDSASRTFHQVGRAASGTDTVMGKLAKTARIAGEAVAIGLAAGLAEGVKSAVEFQSEMTRISTQAGATTKDVKILSQQVLKLGESTQQGPQALAESLYHLKSVGMDNVSAMKALKESSDLAAVGHANLEETTNALAGAWRTGIKGATSFHEAVSTVNAIIGAGNMSMDQFNAAIGTGILPSAKTFGLSMKQVGAALALMTDEGIDSASAATRLRMSFSLLGAPSKAAEKQLGKIGLTGLQLADAMRGPKGLIGAIGLLKDHLDKSGLSASKQSQLLSRAFGGGRSSSGILLMLNNLDVLEKKQLQINRSTGKFDDAVKLQRKTAEAQWKLLTSNLEVMGVRVGTKVLPYVTDFVRYLNTDAMPEARRFGKVMEDIIPVGKISKGITTATAMIGDFFKGLNGGPAKAKTAALPTPQLKPLSPSASLLPAKGPTVLPSPMLKAPSIPKSMLPAAPKKSDAQKLGEQIRSAISGGIENLNWGKVGASVGAGLGKAFEWVGQHGAELTKKVGTVIGSIDWVNVGKAFGVIAVPLSIGFITNAFEPLFHVDFWKKHWMDAIVAVISVVPIGKAGGAMFKLGGKLTEAIGEGAGRVPWSRIIPFAEKLAESVGPLLRGVGRWVGRLVEGFGSSFSRQFPRIAQRFSDELALLPVRLGDLGRLLLRKGGELVGKLGDGIVNHVPGMGNRFIRATVKIFGRFTFWQAGVNLAQGLLNGIAAGLADVGSWLKTHVYNPVVNWVKHLFGIHSPSTVFAAIGRDLVAGLRAGIVAGAKGIGAWVYGRMGAPARAAFSGAGGWLVGHGRGFVSGLKSGIVGGARGIGSWVNSHVISPARSVFRRSGSWLTSPGRSLISGLKSGVLSGVKGIGSWMKKYLVDPVVSSVKHFFGVKSPSRVFMSIGGHLVSGLMKGMARTSGTAIAKKVFGSLPKALAAIAKKGLVSISSLPEKALKALGGLGSGLLSALGIGGGGGGGGVNRWSADVAAVLNMLGAPAYAQAAVLKRIQIESGGNPNAINLTDSNAKAGHPSQGLMQTIPGTFNAYAGPFRGRGITDPLASIYAGVNYAMHRYGSNWINVMTRPGGYAGGTDGAAKGLAWVGEKGPELVNFKGGEDVLSHPDSMAFAKANSIALPGYASGTITNAADRVRRARQKVEDDKDAVASAKRRHKGIAAAEKRLKAAEAELKAANISLANARRSAKTSVANTIATGLLKTLETGTSSAIGSAIKSLATKLLNAGYSKTAASVQSKGSKLQTLADKRASVQAQINAANAYAADQASNIKDFLSISGTSATDVGSLISQMGGQQKTASGFVSLTKSLKARGASKDLLAQLSEAGPGSQLASVLGAKNVTTGDISKLNSLVASGGKLATSFGKDMADLMYDTGKHAGEGFLAGLKATEKDLQKQINKLATDLVKAIKTALKIKSPSVVFRDEVGKQVVLGMVHGMDMHGHLVGASAQRLADTATGVSVRRRYVPTATAASAARQQDALWERFATALENQQGGTEVHVHFNDDRLKDLVDVQVKPKIKASESAQAFRAKVGRRSGS
jgi:TP901 family phage tail tape measure protein